MSNVKVQISWFDKLTMGILSLSKDGIWAFGIHLAFEIPCLGKNAIQ